MYSDPSSLSIYRVTADPLGRIGEVKSSLMTFSPATTPSLKTRCSFQSVPPVVTGGEAPTTTGFPLTETLLIADLSSNPLIFRQSKTIGVIGGPASFFNPLPNTVPFG